jgi:hypothetical protein
MPIEFANHYATMKDIKTIEDKILYLKNIDLQNESDPFKYIELFNNIDMYYKSRLYALLIAQTFKEKCGTIILGYDITTTNKKFYTIMNELDHYDTISIRTKKIFKIAFRKVGMKYASECDINLLHSMYSNFILN